MGVAIRGRRMFALHFADDQVILEDDEIDIDYMIRKLNKWGLTLNTSIIAYLVVGKKANYRHMGANIISGTETFKYMEAKYASTGESNDKINYNTQLNNLLWSNRIVKNNKKKNVQSDSREHRSIWSRTVAEK